MKKVTTLLTVFLLTLIFSCATNVKTKQYSKDSFDSFKTFAYLPNTSFKVEDFESRSSSSIQESLITTLNTKMVEKGYKVDTENPDLLVLLATTKEIQSNLDNRKNNYEQAPSNSRGSNANSPNYASISSTETKSYFSTSDEALLNKAYKEGTLVVEIFNSKTKELVWVGIAENFKAHISDQTLMTRMINEIFKEFPK